MPIPLGKLIWTSSFFDANQYHDLVTGCAMTCILHIINQTPIEWYCKKQATVASLTYSLLEAFKTLSLPVQRPFGCNAQSQEVFIIVDL